ncbi:ribbon-helix-helix DNA binding domain protein [Gordonia phage NHagos]|nr:ribbon-helix-helix DNA binding domain protein [Gordonia phage NHagos]
MVSMAEFSYPPIMVRSPAHVADQLKRRLKVACAEDGIAYWQFIERALDERDATMAKMRHPLDRAALSPKAKGRRR